MQLPDGSLLEVPAEIVSRIQALPLRRRRRLVAVAGPPASGKSTTAAALTAALKAAGAHAECVPMDGFHLDNRILDSRDLRARKGAPETFDADGFIALMQRFLEDEEVVYPLFDRARDIAIAGAGVVTAACDLVVIEGNYLLFDEEPWSRLIDIWDHSIWVDVSEDTVVARCTARWLEHGHAPEAARARAEGNDLRNARRIFGARLPADTIVSE